MTKSADTLYREAEELFAPAIARLSRAVERDADKARDLEQDIHCALWTSFARFKGDCSLKTWVYRVAHNVAADHIDKSARGPKKVPLKEIDTLPFAGNLEKEAGRSLVLAQVDELIRCLPPLDAQVIVLWLEGETTSDISDITGLSQSAAGVRVHRIKSLLAGHFETPLEAGETP